MSSDTFKNVTNYARTNLMIHLYIPDLALNKTKRFDMP